MQIQLRMYIPVTFKINEDIKSSGAPEVVQVYSMSSSSKVTLLTMIPITMPSRVSIVWLGVSPVTIVLFRVMVALNKFPLLVNTVSQVRFIASPIHASDGIPTNGCRYAVKETYLCMYIYTNNVHTAVHNICRIKNFKNYTYVPLCNKYIYTYVYQTYKNLIQKHITLRTYNSCR